MPSRVTNIQTSVFILFVIWTLLAWASAATMFETLKKSHESQNLRISLSSAPNKSNGDNNDSNNKLNSTQMVSNSTKNDHRNNFLAERYLKINRLWDSEQTRRMQGKERINVSVSRISENNIAVNTTTYKEYRVEAKVSIYGASLRINGKKVFHLSGSNSSFSKRLVSVNELKGGVSAFVMHERRPDHVMLSQHFATHTVGEDTRLLTMLEAVQPGRLVLLLGRPNFATWLRPTVCTGLRRLLGCECDLELAEGESWALLATVLPAPEDSQHGAERRTGVLYEGYVTTHVFNGSLQLSSPHRFEVTLRVKEGPHCPGSDHLLVRARAKFCATYEGYGAFCSCHNPVRVDPVHMVESTKFPPLPVTMVGAGRRLPMMLAQVQSIRTNSFSKRAPMLMSIDGNSEEARELGRLLGVPVMVHDTNKGRNARERINEHIKWSLNTSLAVFPQSEWIIILEDDLKLAPDFMSYFHQTSILMKYDPTLQFVNAHRYNAYPHTAMDPSVVLRAQGYPYYGWMVGRNDAVNLIQNWLPLHAEGDWDMYIKVSQMKGRRTLLPEVPRTKHEGGAGVHVTGEKQEVSYSRRPLNDVPHVTLNLARMWELAYNLDLMLAINRSQVLHIIKNPCIESPIPKQQNNSYVIYITADGDVDEDKSFYVIARCLGLYDEMHEHYEITFRLRYHGTEFYIVGCPVSPFCLAEKHLWYKPTPVDVAVANKWFPFQDNGKFGKIRWRLPPLDHVEEFLRDNISGQHINYYYPSTEELKNMTLGNITKSIWYTK